MNIKNKIKVLYYKYGRLVFKIVMVGMIVVSITNTLLPEVALAYELWDITAPYGEVTEIHPNGHDGVDFAVPVNTPLASVVDGTVEKVRDTGEMGFGRSVHIRTEDGRLVTYAHLNSWSVEVGQSVSKGDIIALSGNTGRSTGPHLHFQVNLNGKPIDPLGTILEGLTKSKLKVKDILGG